VEGKEDLEKEFEEGDEREENEKGEMRRKRIELKRDD
jgi:hypothetical protein